ncbi:HAD family hydrolase [Caproiciproducens sp. LBM24188]
MIQNIVFDMGRVLIHYQPPEYVKPFVKEEADQRLLLNAIFDAPDWPDNDRGTVTYEEFLERIRSRTPERLYHAAEQVWKNWILYLTPIPETNQLAMELKRCGYRLFLLSNVSTRYYEFRKTIMAIDNFDGEFLSAEVHRIKPDPEIYRLFFQRFALNPEECFLLTIIRIILRRRENWECQGSAMGRTLRNFAALWQMQGSVWKPNQANKNIKWVPL